MSELRILLVEDSAADAELAKVRLRGVGEVEHCASLAAALARGARGFVHKGALSTDELSRRVREAARAGDRP